MGHCDNSSPVLSNHEAPCQQWLKLRCQKWFSMKSYNDRKFLYLPQFIWSIRSSSTSIRASLYPEDGERDRWSCVSHESYKWFSMESYNGRKFLYLPQFIWPIRSSSTSIRASLYPEDGERDRWSCVSHESYKWFSMESYNGRKFLYLPQFIWPIRSSSTSIRASHFSRGRWMGPLVVCVTWIL